MQVLLRGSASRVVSSGVKQAQHRRVMVAATASGADSKPVKIAFIGAGGINFGTLEGPWNHSARLEQLPGVEFTALVDPNVELAQKRLKDKQAGKHADKWKGLKLYKDYHEMLQAQDDSRPDAVFIGVPPTLHGAVHDPKANMELQLAEAKMHLFVEKPISVRPADEVALLADKLQELQHNHNLVVAVGYMFRYSALALKAKEILERYNAKPVQIVARYACAYTYIEKPGWWDTNVSGGPIVEQATHFIDLMRFFGGEIVPESIHALAVGPDYPLSDMPKPPQGEHEIPMERRNNRATSAVFRFDSGAIGNLNHSVLMHKSAYTTDLEVLADGLHVRLVDLYGEPKLLVRHPHEEAYKQEDVGDSDMYLTEVDAFVHAVRTGDTSRITTLYSDAAKSYQASQWITAASNKNRK
jgi:predicted dehydrogenase